jgi:hypothetical protein
MTKKPPKTFDIDTLKVYCRNQSYRLSYNTLQHVTVSQKRYFGIKMITNRFLG